MQNYFILIMNLSEILEILFYACIVEQIAPSPSRSWGMSVTDGDHMDGYCLIYSLKQKFPIHSATYQNYEQLIDYCLRPAHRKMTITNIEDHYETWTSQLNFHDLRAKNISSDQLLSWSAPVDLAEDYQIFLIKPTNVSSKKVFYNCTSSWFGPLCQFSFRHSTTESFYAMVRLRFAAKLPSWQSLSPTCYEHHSCRTTSSICLDWRQICDNRKDCLDGSDESLCFSIETSICQKNEYRCRNGQCVPKEFFDDFRYTPDCADETDEFSPPIHGPACFERPSSFCEESRCRAGLTDSPCGDGQCTHEIAVVCHNGRNRLQLNDTCSKAMACRLSLFEHIDQNWCKKSCGTHACVRDHCPSMFDFPSTPVVLGHVRFVFNRSQVKIEPNERISLPTLICYDEGLCRELLTPSISYRNWTCNHFQQLGLLQNKSYSGMYDLLRDMRDIFGRCLTSINPSADCDPLIMYQCRNSSKCIAKSRLLDAISDCPWRDDELFEHSCALDDAQRFRLKCIIDKHEVCLAPIISANKVITCTSQIDDGDRHLYFPLICNQRIDLPPILIDGENQTDETDCQRWPCNNTYTRCDGYWHCLNGADEINCSPSLCPPMHHSCVFPNDTLRLSCLPIERTNDGKIDCLGASDERQFCRKQYPEYVDARFLCRDDDECLDVDDLCNAYSDCSQDDDEIFCTDARSSSLPRCSVHRQNQTEVERFFCNLHDRQKPRSDATIAFKFESLLDRPEQSSRLLTTNPISVQNVMDLDHPMCNRGLAVLIRQALSCLCPPSYYGDRCQYQNQRVSVTLQMVALSNWRDVWTVLIVLIDEERTIEASDRVDYVAVADCRSKHFFYLLYLHRPKNQSKNYSVHIDAFQRQTLTYRASWIFPIRFPFLPVYHLAARLQLPIPDEETIDSCSFPCVHGQCHHYINHETKKFCRCSSGWSGVHCDIPYECSCASHSLCLGPSLCLCPIGYFGRRCHLGESSCQPDRCLHHGQCIPSDQRGISFMWNPSICLCSTHFYGDRCEHRYTRLKITIDDEISIPQSLLIHYITVRPGEELIQTSTMKKIIFDQKSFVVFTSSTFHMVFAQMSEQYYLLIVRHRMIVSEDISVEISPSSRCKAFSELFPPSFVRAHRLKRMKFYHQPCEQRHDLVCFYDDPYFCLCNLYRQANCFEATFNATNSCDETKLCRNQGRCFLDNMTCPTAAVCVCPDCFYGSRCQFSTKGLTLSLDAILGYQIYPHTTLLEQSLVIKCAILVTLILSSGGFVNGFLALMTFRRASAREVGCGVYLLVSSIASMLISVVLVLKLTFLLVSQLKLVEQRWIVQLQCQTIDYLLRVLLVAVDWLHACVAVERVINIFKGIRFNQKLSRQSSSRIITLVIVFTSISHLHDPLNRRLIDDEDEQRTWCLTQYAMFIQIYDSLINTVHFSIPLSINGVSAVSIVLLAARRRSNAHKNQSYRKHLRDQFHHHKHLVISSSIIILLTLPRLVLSLLSECMKSGRNPWFYLIAYFVSFIPPALIFVIFVFPSELYMKEFKKALRCGSK